jgi:hypothetical protein
MGERSRKRAEGHYSMRFVAKCYEDLWTELSNVAQTMSLTEAGSNYAQPNYFRFFGHYATAVLDGSAPLALTSFGKSVARGREPLPLDPQVVHDGILERALLERLLVELGRLEERSYSSDTPDHRVRTTAADVLGLMSAEANCGEARKRRHLMWLLKYGLLGFGEGTA